MTEDRELRARITAEMRRLWQEAKDWESKGFAGEPLVVSLRSFEATAKATALEEPIGKVGRALRFRVTWNDGSSDWRVEVLISLQPEGDSHFFPYGGVRILTDNPSTPTEGDIFWGEFKDESLVNVPICQYCKRLLERACQHKNQIKFFRYKQRAPTS